MAHTKGPWKVSTGSVYVDNGKEWPTICIALMDRSEPYTRPVERDDNAHLIAASPTLLEALERIARNLRASQRDGMTPAAIGSMAEVATEAIKQAKS